jgi:hypothetical protein
MCRALTHSCRQVILHLLRRLAELCGWYDAVRVCARDVLSLSVVCCCVDATVFVYVVMRYVRAGTAVAGASVGTCANYFAGACPDTQLRVDGPPQVVRVRA